MYDHNKEKIGKSMIRYTMVFIATFFIVLEVTSNARLALLAGVIVYVVIVVIVIILVKKLDNIEQSEVQSITLQQPSNFQSITFTQQQNEYSQNYNYEDQYQFGEPRHCKTCCRTLRWDERYGQFYCDNCETHF
jgi:Ca2+/Na+ antiporter